MKGHSLLVLGTFSKEPGSRGGEKGRRGGGEEERGEEGRRGGMRTQVPEWAQPPLLQQLWKEPFSPPPTAPSNQLHILKLEN